MAVNENILRKIAEKTDGDETMRSFIFNAIVYESDNTDTLISFEKKYSELLKQGMESNSDEI